MGAKIGSSEDEAISDINIVPFVDIILVVLIIFMVTTPYIMRHSIPLNLPKAVSGSETVPSQMNITIGKTGEALLNGKLVTNEEISASSKESLAKNPEIQTIISADREVSHGRVIEIIDLVKATGIQKFAITIEKKN